MKRLLIVGAGGRGRSVAEAVLAGSEFIVAGFLDDAFPEFKRVRDVPVLGRVDDLAQWWGVADCVFVAPGNNMFRQRVAADLRAEGFSLATVLHPSAIISPTAVIGDGSKIMVGAIVGAEAWLGEGVIVNCTATVDHHCHVGDFGHLGIDAAMTGESVLGAAAWMQAGSVLGYGAEIEAGCVLELGEPVRL